MFDIAPSELLLVGFVALVVIGPKDLPKAMRIVGYWVGKARGVARQFRSGFDSMVREAELEEMEKRWASENERIMREHPQPASDVVEASDPDGEAAVVTVEKPVVAPADTETASEPQVHGQPSPHTPDLFDTARSASDDQGTAKS
ncbi:Sec-independent protein translocase protein TatB [Sphingomonas sp. PB2P19]|uniref:Sec-independent protein translocase protein TatB n=1 Tax=Sphingomonas rhamnosi TaxID=3096156 RepID=UPI002FCC8870